MTLHGRRARLGRSRMTDSLILTCQAADKPLAFDDGASNEEQIIATIKKINSILLNMLSNLHQGTHDFVLMI